MGIACCVGECQANDCVQLTERESSVCQLICSSKGPVSFGALTQATGLHQEIASRIVRRLMVHGLVKKTGDGYTGECVQ